MTIAPLPPGTTNFYGPNGVLLAGGSVTNYIPRTTFFKTTWTGATQSTANANPVTLSSAGSAVMFGWGAYRQIVKDANGNTIWDSPTAGGPLTQTIVVLGERDGGVFYVPTGIYSLYVEVVGAGGSGSNCLAASATGDVSGGGGGAGGFANGVYAVTPGTGISYFVGRGGGIGLQADGTTTNFGTFLSGTGGAGSSFSTLGTSVGGQGGTSTGGTIMNNDGGNGTDGSHIPPSGGSPYVGPGTGAASFYGPGGNAANGSNGGSGIAPGSGGGGAMDVNLQNTFFNGGAGADGQIVIGYWG